MNEPVNNGLQNGAQSNESINPNPQMQAPSINETNISGHQPQTIGINNDNQVINEVTTQMNTTTNNQIPVEPQMNSTTNSQIPVEPQMNSITNSQIPIEPQMNSEIQPPINNISQNESKNSKNKKLLIGLFIAIVVIVVALFTCIALLASPKKVFTIAIDKVFKSADKISGKDIKTISGNFSLDANISANENNEVYNLINDIDFNLNYGFDYENKKMNVDLDSTYKNKELINIDMTAKDDTLYILLEDIFDKYLSTEIEDFSKIFENKDLIDNTNTILNELNSALKDSLKDEYFTSEDTKISINGKDTKVTKNILTLNSKNTESLIKDIAKKLNNDNFIKSVASLTEEDESAIKETLQNIQEFEFENNDEIITISIYTKGIIKNAIGYEIKTEESSIIVLEDTKNIYKYTINTDGEKIEGTVKINEKDNKTNIDITTKIEGTEITLKITTSYKYNEKIKDINVKNSVDINKLTEEEQNEITTNLYKNETILELIETFSTMFNSNSIDYDYSNNETSTDYYFDYSSDSNSTDYYTNDNSYDYDTIFSY